MDQTHYGSGDSVGRDKIIHQHIEATKPNKTLGNKPLRPEVFIGREGCVDALHTALQEHTKLLVHGEGGIGKTTLIAQYYYHFFEHYAHLIWLVFERTIGEALDTLVPGSLHIELSPDTTPEKRSELILHKISNLDKPVLLVIDNVDGLNELKETLTVIRKLGESSIHILMTSRTRDGHSANCFPVEKLEEKDGVALFRYHYKHLKPEEEDLLKKILVAIDYNTLIIELLAKNLSKFNNELGTAYSLKNLLADIQQKGVLALKKQDKISTDYHYQKATPDEIILAMYDLVQLSPEKKQALSALAFLPSASLPFEDLKVLLPDMEQLHIVLMDLYREGWCTYEEDTKSFKLSPIIAEVIREKVKGREADEVLPALVKILKEKLSVGTHGSVLPKLKWMPYASTVFPYLHICSCIPPEDKAGLAFRIAYIHQHQNNFSAAEAKYEEALQIRRSLAEKSPEAYLPDVAGTLNNLAVLHSDKNDFTTAEAKYEEALQHYRSLAEKSPAAYLPDVAMTLNNLANLHSDKNDFTTAEAKYEEALRIRRSLAEKSPEAYLPDVAMTLNNLANLHSAKNDFTTAEAKYEEALQIRRSLAEKSPEAFLPDVAETLVNLSIFYLQAVPDKEKSVALAREVLEIADRFPQVPAVQEYAKEAIEVLRESGVERGELSGGSEKSN